MRYELNLVSRYLLALLLVIFQDILYYIFAPLTLYASYFILNLFYPATLQGIQILTEKGTFTFIEACVATLAYLLLAMLILATKGLSLKRSIALFLHGTFIIFTVNIFRIELLVYAFLTKRDFTLIHLFFWEFISTLLVFLTWIYLIKKYKVKSIPIVSDFRYLLKTIKK